MAPEPPSSVQRPVHPKEQPWILPSNRKLRNLNCVSFRNLNLTPSAGRPRGQTIDDGSLPTTLQTPAKMLANRESQKLGHSKSSDDLKASAAAGVGVMQENTVEEVQRSLRPLKDRLRRRSTLNWISSAPQSRQQKLEDATIEHMADMWFSLHCDGVDDPVYISEIAEKAMNPLFKSFDLGVYGPLVTRQEQFTIKFWARAHSMENFMLLLDLRVSLRSLQFVGKNLESFHHPLPSNCVLFHLTDGIYTSFTDLPLEETLKSQPKTSKQSPTVQSTSSFDSLMRLSNLDDCIQDALATRERLTAQIGRLLEEQKTTRGVINQALEAEERLRSTNRSLSNCRRQVQSAQARCKELEDSLQARRAAITMGRKAQEEAQTKLTASEASLSASSTRWRETKAALSGQIRRICEDLLTIYPIEPIDPKSLLYAIRGLPLPDAQSTTLYSNEDSASTAAALGLVAQIVQLLSLYLSTPVPYPPTPHGSTSTIYDPISTSMPSIPARTFPLFETGAVAYRFEYGVFLLNSDIELLMSRQGAKAVDLRDTLPNLKYVLTVLTAGKGELPSRKKGGVRALQIGKAPVGGGKTGSETVEKVQYTNGRVTSGLA